MQRTPLYVAAREGRDYTMRYLVEKGANAKIEDKDGVSMTILQYYCWFKFHSQGPKEVWPCIHQSQYIGGCNLLCGGVKATYRAIYGIWGSKYMAYCPVGKAPPYTATFLRVYMFVNSIFWRFHWNNLCKFTVYHVLHEWVDFEWQSRLGQPISQRIKY